MRCVGLFFSSLTTISNANTSTSDQFCHGKTWQYPRKSVDIATEKRFFPVAVISSQSRRPLICVARATTPSRRYSHVLYKVFKKMEVIYPRRSVAVSTQCRRCIDAIPSLYPRCSVALSMACRRLSSLYPRLILASVAVSTGFEIFF